MLKKSTVNPEQPNIKDAPAASKGMGKQPPQAAAKTGGKEPAKNIAQVEIQPAGRNSSSSRYTAPRKEGSSAPFDCGYTKPGKM